MASASAAKNRVSRSDAVVRVVVAIAGTLVGSLLASACIGRFLPVPEGARLAVAVLLSIPLWVGGMCVGFLARRGAVALAVCALVTLVLATLVFGVPR